MSTPIDLSALAREMTEALERFEESQRKTLADIKAAASRLRSALARDDAREVHNAAGALFDAEWESGIEVFGAVHERLEASGLYDGEAYVAETWAAKRASADG